ncbi:MAG: dephospho-CoA kinase [Gemmatimonadota bacterium]|nr:dephospho-CoA kinase [Gemmatimonadota bacterium]
MLNVALTGNVAAGKSTITGWFREWGATVIDADALVREVQQPGSPVLTAIRERFGDPMIRPDGTLDRAALRRVVFVDPAAREALNRIVHPAVQTRRMALVAEARRRGDRIVVNDIPLLFEVLDPGTFDVVILVDAPDAVRRERLMRSRGLLADEANRLMAAQWPATVKRGRSAIVIDNDGTVDDLRLRARAAWQQLLDLAKTAG